MPQFARLNEESVYPGINLTFYGNQGRLEHDFVVQPGADYHLIKLQFDGARDLSLDPDGNLQLAVPEGLVSMQRPLIYQVIEGQKRTRSGRFVIQGKRVAGFAVDDVDPRVPLVIDPVLDYSTFLANTSITVDGAAVDGASNTYITGIAFSQAYPATPNAFQGTCDSCTNSKGDVFITKLNAAGTALIYSTYLGGSDIDQPSKIVVDSNGDAIVTGWTWSTDFPMKNPISAGVPSYNDGFITSLAPDGASLNFSSRLGGSSSVSSAADTYSGGLAVDANGSVYVSGTTESPYLPVTSGALHAGTPGYTNKYVFLTKLTSVGALSYSAIVGKIGESSDCCSVIGLSLDAQGDAYIAGTAGATFSNDNSSTPWPVTQGAYQTQVLGNEGLSPFVTEVSPDGSSLVYSTLVGSGLAQAFVLAPGNLPVLAGGLASNFPVTADAYSSVAANGFVAKLSADGSQLLYGSYLSTGASNPTNLALDAAGDVWLTGATGTGANLPLVNPLQSVPMSGTAWIAEFDPPMHNLLFSSYFNGTQYGALINGLALDAQGRAHIAGTASDDIPVTPGAYLTAVSPPPPYTQSQYGFAAVIDPAAQGPGICFPPAAGISAQIGFSQQGTLTVKNCGNDPLTVSNVVLASPVFALGNASTCVTTLAPGASCDVVYTFTPNAIGTATATLSITSNAPVPVYNESLVGSGTAPVIQTYPSQSVTFFPQVLGNAASGSTATLDVVNDGLAPLVVSSAQATITGDFSIVGNDCQSPLQNGYGCTFTLAFQPTTTGTRTGTLTVPSNDPFTPSLTVGLSGVALSAYNAPTISFLSVPSIPVGSPATTLTIQGTNFFPTSQVSVGGELLPTTFNGASSLQVTLDPTLLTLVGEVPVSVINPAPGGSSNTVPLIVYRSVPVSGSSMVYNSTTGKLYVAVPASATTNANSVLPIDPTTGAIGTPISVGMDPGTLALSSDNTYLFVGNNGDHTLQRINLTTGQVERTFSLPIDPDLQQQTTVYDMQAVPGSPTSVVVSLQRLASPEEAGAAMFNDGGLVNFLANDYGNKNFSIDTIAFTSDPSTLYAIPFNGNFFTQVGVSSAGLRTIPSANGSVSGFGCCDETVGSDVVSDGTLLYTNAGQVWNPGTQTLLGTYTGPSEPLFYEQGVLPDPSTKRTYFLDSNLGYNDLGGYTGILSFDQTTFHFVGEAAFGLNASLDVSALSRWGADGFAFLVYQSPTLGVASAPNQVILARSSLAHTGTGATPTLGAATPASATTGTPTTAITLTGSGFIPGTAVFWNGSLLETVYTSATQLTVLVPSTEFTVGGTAQITASNPGGAPASAPLAFPVLGPGLSLSATSLSFGSINVGSSASSQLTVTNTGTSAITAGGVALTGSGAASFSQTTTCGATLVPGASCSFSLVFAPTSSGAAQATLTLTDSAPGSPQSVALSGTGVLPTPSLTFTAVPPHTYGDSPFAISATSASTGAITYSVLSGPATVSGGTLTVTGAGTVVLQATQTATSSYGSASVNQTFQVAPAPLSAQVAGATRLYGTANPVFVATITGAVNGDSFVGTVSTTATTASPVGSYSLTPSVTGPALANYSVTLNSGTLIVKQASSSVSLASSASTVNSGQTVTLTASVTAGTSGVPSGSVQFVSGSSVLGSASLTNGVATLAISTLPQGSSTVFATYSGDTNFTGSTSSPTQVEVVGTPKLVLAAIPNHTYGDSPFVLSATSASTGTVSYAVTAGPARVSGTTLTLTGAGTVTVQASQAAAGDFGAATTSTSFQVAQAPLTVQAGNATRAYGTANPSFAASFSGAVNGDTFTTSVATAATVASPVGSYPLVPSVSGPSLANYSVAATNGNLTITQAASTIGLALSTASAGVGQNVTFTATVVSSTSGTPTGTVQFLNGSTSLGTATLSGGGAAFTSSKLAAGSYNLSAVYSGDTNFLSSTSPAKTEVIVAPDYSLTVAPSTLSVKQGGSGTAVFTVTPVGGFNQAVNFSCAGLPSGVSCAFAPPSLTPNGSPVTSTLTVTATGASARKQSGPEPFDPAAGGGAALALLCGLGLVRRRRLRVPSLLAMLLALGVCIPFSGCGGSSPNAGAPTQPITPAGTYSVSVTANAAAGTASAGHSVALSITITQ